MFRKAAKEDVPVLEKILTEAWRQTYQKLYTTAYIERVIEEFYNPTRLIDEVTHFSKDWSGYYVYEVEDKIVGCIAGGIEAEGVGSVYVLYLDPTEKRKEHLYPCSRLSRTGYLGGCGLHRRFLRAQPKSRQGAGRYRYHVRCPFYGGNRKDTFSSKNSISCQRYGRMPYGRPDGF